ncbi:MAG: beta strand repeat-containing protein, partial [Xanthobacteraceae bacterium]
TSATASTTITVFSPFESPPDLQATLSGLTGGNAVEDTPVIVASITDGDTPPVSVSPSSSSVSYQWQISSDGTNWTNILGATSSSYDPTAADFGMHLRVEIFYSENDGGGTTIDTVTKSAGIVGEANEVVASGGNWKQPQSWVGNSVPTSTQNAVVETNIGMQINGSDSETVGSLSLEGINKGVSVASNSTLTVDGPITVLGGSLSVTGSSLLIFGNVGGGISANFIVSGSGSSVIIGGGNTLQSAGPSDVILVAASSTFTDNGTIEVLSGKKLEISGAIAGTGIFLIDSGATLKLDTAESLNVLFAAATGLLVLGDPTQFTGTISASGGSLQAGDVIDVSGFDTGASIAYSGTTAGGTVTISEAGHTPVTLSVGANSTHWFITGLDSSGTGILIHDPPTDTSATDFVSNPIPVTENAGILTVSDGAVLPLDGVIDNSGAIALDSTGDQTELQIGSDVRLQGGGDIVMSGGEIVAAGQDSMLTNVDETISGYGQIGSGTGDLTFINNGTINADISGCVLTIDTGNTVVNDGVLEASGGGTLFVDDPVIGTGSAVIAGGTLIFEASSTIDVTFDNGSGTPAYGELVLADASHFSGQIFGFSGNEADAGHSDAVDLVGFTYGSTVYSESILNGDMVLTATDGSATAVLIFENFDGTLQFASDGKGGTVITDSSASSAIAVDGSNSLNDSGPVDASVTPERPDYIGSVSADAQDPALSQTQTISVSIGGPGADNFVFTPGIGADTIVNFNPQQDTIEFDHFANVQTVQELQSLITTDAHDNAVIDLGHNDSVTLQGVTTQQLQQVIQEGHVLLH